MTDMAISTTDESARRGWRLPETLPPLKGRGLKAYNIVWLAALAAALLMTGIGAWKGFTPMQYGWLNYGLSLSPDNNRVALVLGQEALAAGIATGDEVLAIDNIPMAETQNTWSAMRDRLAKPEGTTTTFAMRDAEGREVTHRLASRAENVADREAVRQGEAAFALITQIGMLLAAILLFRRRREPVPAILALSFLLLAATGSADASLWLDNQTLEVIGGVLGFGLLVLGLLIFPDGEFGAGFVRAMLACIVGWAISLFVLPYDIAGYIFYLGLSLLFLIVASAQVLRYRRPPAGSRRQQLRWAIFGFTLGMVLLLTSLLISVGLQFRFLTVSSSAYFLISLVSSAISTLGVICIVGGLLVSPLRYRLYDADAIIGRSAIFGILGLSFVALFTVGEKAIGALGRAYLGGELGATAGGIAAIAAAVLVVPMHRRVHDWAERRFQKNLLCLRHDLPEQVGDLRETAPAERIAGIVARTASESVQSCRAAILLEDGLVATHEIAPDAVAAWPEGRDIAGEPSEIARRDPLFPVRLALEAQAIGRIGWLLLGPRPDGSLPGKDEKDALADIVSPVARALDIALTREKRETSIWETLQRLEARIDAWELAIPAHAAAATTGHQ